MTRRAAADRYARALLDVAIREADATGVERELVGFRQLLAEHEALERALTNPAVPPARKRAAVKELAARLGLSAPVSRLLLLLAERDRLVLLPDLVAAYTRRLREHQQIVKAEVVTAMPLGAGQAKAVEDGLRRLTGKRVELDTRVDPELMGGIVARVGSTVYDGSVRRHLERIRESLSERP